MTPKQRKLYIAVAIIAVTLIVLLIIVSTLINNDNPASNSPGDTANTTQANDTANNELSISDTPASSDGSQNISYNDIANWSGSIIVNYDSVVRNLPQQRRDNASKMLLYTLADNGVSTIPSDITIRDGSYSQTIDPNTMTYYTTYIVDIPSIKQSYRITDQYSAVESYDPTSYATVVTCLDQDELIYGSFNCSDQIKQEKGE